MIPRLRRLLEENNLLNVQGRTFYSHPNTFTRERNTREGRTYFLGSNASGDDNAPRLRDDFGGVLQYRDGYNAYVDEKWGTPPADPGEYELQRNVRKLLEMLDLDVRNVCCSNLILRSTPNLRGIKRKVLKGWVQESWPIHQAVMNRTRPRVIVLYGMTAYDFLREREFGVREVYGRWHHTIAVNDLIIHVVGLNHLSWSSNRPEHQIERVDLIRTLLED